MINSFYKKLLEQHHFAKEIFNKNGHTITTFIVTVFSALANTLAKARSLAPLKSEKFKVLSGGFFILLITLAAYRALKKEPPKETPAIPNDLQDLALKPKADQITTSDNQISQPGLFTHIWKKITGETIEPPPEGHLFLPTGYVTNEKAIPLPTENLNEIFDFLSPEDVASMQSLNKDWNQAVKSDVKKHKEVLFNRCIFLAKEAAKKIIHSRSQSRALVEILKLEIKCGLIEEAKSTFKFIKDDKFGVYDYDESRLEAYLQIVKAQIKYGLIQESKLLLKELEYEISELKKSNWTNDEGRIYNDISKNKEYQCKIVLEIIRAQIKHGFIEEALTTASDSIYTFQAYAEVIGAYAEHGFIEEAIKIAKDRNMFDQKSAFKIAKAQIEHGFIEEARKTVGRIRWTLYENKILIKIAEAEIERGLIDEAKKTLKKVEGKGNGNFYSWEKKSWRLKVAEVYVKKGWINQAKEILQKIEGFAFRRNDIYQLEVYLEIAKAEFKKGLTDQANKTLQDIKKKSENLPEREYELGKYEYRYRMEESLKLRSKIEILTAFTKGELENFILGKLRWDPSKSEIILILTLQSERDITQAKKMIHLLNLKYPDYKIDSLYNILADVLFQQNRIEEANKILKEIENLDKKVKYFDQFKDPHLIEEAMEKIANIKYPEDRVKAYLKLV